MRWQVKPLYASSRVLWGLKRLLYASSRVLWGLKRFG